VTLSRPFVRGFVAVVLLATLLAGAWLWVRDSALAGITEVTITGATTSDEARIRAALEDVARDMTTLNVREDALREAVAAYPSVADLYVDTDFPHGLSIEVVEHRPVAALQADGRRVPVSGGGIVMTGVRADRELPAIRVASVPPDARIHDGRTRTALAVAAAAPEALLRRGERLRYGPNGLMMDLRDGPPLIFGSEDGAHAKWAAAARVLAEPSAAGATYLDLRAPGRVAAGGLGPVPQETVAPMSQP
jgi:cell division protein FtsQ